MKRYGSLCFVFILYISLSAQERSPIKVTDMLKIRTASGISLNKEGTKAVFTLTSIEQDGDSKWEYKYVNQLWMVSTDGSSAAKQMTTSKEGSSQAAFSPDGKQIAFVRSVDTKPQIFLLSLEGGEPVQLTKFKYGASSPKWSPDGKQIIFSSSISLKDLVRDSVLNPSKGLPKWPLEKPGYSTNEYLRSSSARPDPDGSIDEIRAYLDQNATDKKARVVNKLNFQDEMDVNPELSLNHYFITEARPNLPVLELTPGFYRYNYADFTPDGNQVIIVGDIDSVQHPDRAMRTEIYMVNKDGSNWHSILNENDKTFNSPQISPSGKWLAFIYNKTGAYVTIPQLAVMPAKGNFNERIELPFDRNKSNLSWSEDEKFLYFSAQSNGGQPIYRAELSSKKIEQLTDENSGVLDFRIRGNKMVYVRTEVSSPSEIYMADASAKNSRRISSLNTEWLSGRKLSIPEKHSFVNEKGMTIEYWVMKPSNFKEGKKYPLLLEIHGGPASMWGPGEASMWHEYQYFCSKGYGVVYSNPRGSGGYGTDFLRGNINDWGTGPTSDVLTALDKTLAAEPWADSSKLLITGGSYAGYLVAWIIAHDQRFKAACSQRGVYDLATFFGEGNAWRLVPGYFSGYPWDSAANAIIRRESPINYVQNIRTPYIIFHGDNDRRTGYVQSEMLYRSLKVLGRPVEYVRHPGATHELTRSGNNRQRIDQMLRTYEFFERWIK